LQANNTFNRGFIFQKKHFWFGAEPVESKHLSSYLRGEKPEHANHNAAWASHTGKGLLFFSKKSSEKTSPAGVINLVSMPNFFFADYMAPRLQSHGTVFLSWYSKFQLRPADQA
jgi:hypothetical protein